jgi:hypothetical protein
MAHDELIEQIALAICREVDDPSCFYNEQDIVRCYRPHAQAALTTMQARLDRVRSIVENGYPNQPAKTDQCKHGRFGYEDCIACYDEALLEALGTSGLVP